MSEVLSKILEAKEQRQLVRKRIGDRGLATISVNFNIPGYPKSDVLILKAFVLLVEELKNHLVAHRISLVDSETLVQTDEAGDIAFWAIKPEKIDYRSLKNTLENFEAKHFLGRILDVDLFDHHQQAISSGKQKPCFICKKYSALHCMREQTHSYQVLRQFVEKRIAKYVKRTKREYLCKDLASKALYAMLSEISLPNKPGLVSPDSNGSHTDMNYQTFLLSASAISVYFNDIAQKGYRWNGKDIEEKLAELRVIGLEMERAMFKATSNVNTHKGGIFLMIYCLFVVAYTLKKEEHFNSRIFRQVLMAMNQGLVKNELNELIDFQSHGQECYKMYGQSLAGGIRQEVELSLPTYFDVVLPYMKQINFKLSDSVDKALFQKQCLRVLLKIMSVNNDTNVLYRSDKQTLEVLKALSIKVLESTDLDFDKAYQSLVDYCLQKRISPGGSADLLAVSLFLYEI